MKKITYEISMCVLALIAVTLAVVDITYKLNYWQTIIDNVILAIFVVDYIIRLAISKDKKDFFKNNILDLISIIPFSSVFRAFRLARLAKLTKITKLFRVSIFSIRLLRKIKRFLNTNGFKYMVVVTTGFIILGGILIHYAEGLSVQDGLWWAFVTATTVGYGDISPETPQGRLIASVLMLVGIGLIGSLTSTITSFFLNNKSKSIKEEIIDMIKTKIDNIDNLTDDDIDNITRLLKSLK